MKTQKETHPNPDYVTIHIDRNLVYNNDVWYTTEYGDKKKAFARLPWIEKIYNFNGVISVSVRPYEVSIKKAKVFSWERILQYLDDVLQQEYPDNVETE